MSDEATPAKVRLTDGLGATPTHGEECAFSACLVIAQIWGASDLQGWALWVAVLPWLAMALAIRLPYSLRAWRNAGKGA